MTVAFCRRFSPIGMLDHPEPALTPLENTHRPPRKTPPKPDARLFRRSNVFAAPPSPGSITHAAKNRLSIPGFLNIGLKTTTSGRLNPYGLGIALVTLTALLVYGESALIKHASNSRRSSLALTYSPLSTLFSSGPERPVAPRIKKVVVFRTGPASVTISRCR
jgi:hypothetical protein